MEMMLDYTNASGINLSDAWRNSSKNGEIPSPPLYMYAYVTLMCAIIFVVGVVGNVLVIQVVIRIRSMRRRMNYFLVCLSVADLLVLLIALPSGLQEFYGKERWHIGDPMCKMVVFSENAAHHCSVLTLLAIGFERYHAICHPLRENFSSRVSSHNILIPLVWILSCLATLPFALIYGTQSTEYIDGSMADQCSVKGVSMQLYEAYIMFIFTVLFALPLVLLTIMYTAISLTIATSAISSLEEKVTCKTPCTGSRQSRSQEKTQHSNSKAIAGRRQVVKMMVAVMLTYFVCLLPLRCMQVWTLFATESDFIDLGQEGYLNLVSTSRILMYLNSASNPVIYGLLSSNFRAAFKQSFLTCRLRRQGRGKYNSAYYNRQHHHHYLYQQTQVTNSNASCSSADVKKEALNSRNSVGENNKLLHCLQKTRHGNEVFERRSLKLGDSPESEFRTELSVQHFHGSGKGPVFV